MPLCYSGYYGKLSCNNDNFIDRIQVVTSKYRGKIKDSLIYPYTLLCTGHYQVMLSLAANNSVIDTVARLSKNNI